MIPRHSFQVRITLSQAANDSRIQGVLGHCTGDLPRLASYLNEGIHRLLITAGEEGFWGGWDKVVFNVSRTDPYITLPSTYARMIAMDVCRSPVRIQNEWYEVMDAGIGLQTPCTRNMCSMEAFERGTVNTAYDLTATNQKIRVYLTDGRDVGKRIIFAAAKDNNGNGIYQTDGSNEILGLKLEMTVPFVTSSMIVTSFGAIAKDDTYGDVVIKQVDATTGDEVLLSRLGPREMNPAYRRYFLSGVPINCCSDPTVTTVQVTAMCKFEFVTAVWPTDFLLIGNIPALKQICQAIRHEEIDNPTSKALAINEQRAAVRMLNQELTHYTGKKQIAVTVAPFGNARLDRVNIGMI